MKLYKMRLAGHSHPDDSLANISQRMVGDYVTIGSIGKCEFGGKLNIIMYKELKYVYVYSYVWIINVDADERVYKADGV